MSQPTQTIYIDCNKASSADKDNLDNSQYTTDLKESITLPKGSQISIQSSFINQQGITGSSIEIDEDIEESFNIMFYKTDTVDLLPNKGASATAPPYVNSSFSSGGGTDTRLRLLDNTAGKVPDANGLNQINNLFDQGATEQPLICMDYVHNAGTSLVDVRVRTIQIKIKKGIYGISEISDIITDQVNGKLDLDYNEKNPTQKAVDEGNFANQTLTQGPLERVIIPDSTRTGNLPDATNSANGETYVFVDVHTAEAFREERITLNDGTGMLFNNGAGAGRGATTAMCQLFNHNEDPSASGANYVPLKNQMYIGTSGFSLDYNNDKSSFELSGLHTPYTFPSHDTYYNPQVQAGKQGTFFRRMNEVTKQLIVSGITDPTAKNLLQSSVTNPLTRLGGIIIHNFAYTTAKKLKTKKGILDADVVQTKYKFKEFFNTELEAKNAWKTTIWSRLGFSYEQLNDEGNFENIRYYNNANATRLPGITTNTYLDNSVIQQISSLVCDTSFSAPPQIDPKTKAPTGSLVKVGLNSGQLRVFTLADANNTTDIATISTVGLYTGSIYNECIMIAIEAAGRPISARNLPILSKVGYYLITSDILDGYNDIVKNGDPLALLGVVAKSSLSNQDFIYSSQDIVNTITNDKIINKIKIRFLNPNLTSPDLESNSSVILRIDIPIVETQGQLLIEQEEEKQEKK